MDPRQQQPKRRLSSSLLLVLVLLAVGLGAWWLSRPGKPAPPAQTADREIDPAAVPQREPPARAPSTAPPPAPAVPARSPEQAAEPELLIVPPGNDDPRPDGALHPHPITPQHLRIQRENALIGQLNGAMDVQDGPGLRRLLDEYRRDYPDDPNQLQEGYAIVADCLEHPGPETRAAGQRYYDRERGSTLRVFVSRHCLEPRD